ncbi:hypothetical protein DQ04_07241010 [Trypanosoma grayi]|uniref:hypothetical protein n=1 Tax=Trypanosoma grayi TaxID=71804 RepID=UPI0004F4702F|nr:hypothetical protein DQ04_07241010 [Trypanosoma grayi]KEG08413.1 hypothetical protein DQ04_07241010 [Trypanosoma grayi]
MNGVGAAPTQNYPAGDWPREDVAEEGGSYEFIPFDLATWVQHRLAGDIPEMILAIRGAYSYWGQGALHVKESFAHLGAWGQPVPLLLNLSRCLLDNVRVSVWKAAGPFILSS